MSSFSTADGICLDWPQSKTRWAKAVGTPNVSNFNKKLEVLSLTLVLFTGIAHGSFLLASHEVAGGAAARTLAQLVLEKAPAENKTVSRLNSQREKNI